MSVVPELAAFPADNPSVVDEDLTRALEARWGSIKVEEAEQALTIVRQIRDARADGRTELKALINRARFAHGTTFVASMLYRYGAAAGSRKRAQAA
ncbi:hypothetical protein JNW90_34520 [Micromonospora sp. STR1s_5]|nr:hypothetical protein [Micromonospora sp. STR1s_5]